MRCSVCHLSKSWSDVHTSKLTRHVSTHFGRSPSVPHIPCERSELHSENHLGSGYLNGLVSGEVECPGDMAS